MKMAGGRVSVRADIYRTVAEIRKFPDTHWKTFTVGGDASLKKSLKKHTFDTSTKGSSKYVASLLFYSNSRSE